MWRHWSTCCKWTRLLTEPFVALCCIRASKWVNHRVRQSLICSYRNYCLEWIIFARLPVYQEHFNSSCQPSDLLHHWSRFWSYILNCQQRIRICFSCTWKMWTIISRFVLWHRRDHEYESGHCILSHHSTTCTYCNKINLIVVTSLYINSNQKN